MGSTPFGIELLYFFVGEPIGLELSPCVDAANVANGEIAGFPNVPLGAVLRVGAGRYAEDAACGCTIGFITRIARCVIAFICVELPMLSGDPGQHTALD